MAEQKRVELVRELVSAYYESWKGGIASYNEARLREILDPDLVLDGPIAGKQTGVDAFLPGLVGFVKTLRSFRMAQTIADVDQAAALYDCDVGAAATTCRFAEFFRIKEGRIETIRLLFDVSEFKRAVGR